MGWRPTIAAAESCRKFDGAPRSLPNPTGLASRACSNPSPIVFIAYNAKRYSNRFAGQASGFEPFCLLLHDSDLPSSHVLHILFWCGVERYHRSRLRILLDHCRTYIFQRHSDCLCTGERAQRDARRAGPNMTRHMQQHYGCAVKGSN